MTLDEARAHLVNYLVADRPDHSLRWRADERDPSKPTDYVSWSADSSAVYLDGDFTVQDLDAIVTWMRAHQQVPV